MSIAPLTFTGVSTYSDDFQTILTRAVSIANLPVTALTNHQTDIQSEKVLASNLNSAIADLSTSLGNLASVSDTKGVAASSSDSTKVTATSTGATPGGTYAITNVTSIARAASETSLTGYAGQQYTSAYTALTGPAAQSLTFTVNDTSGNAQTTTVSLAAGLSGADAATAINTALQATGNAALMGIAATAGTGTISFSGNSTSAFNVAFGDVTTGGGFDTDKNTTAKSTAAPVSKTGTLELNIGGTKQTITLAADKNNLAGLSDAINALNLGVTASVISTGTGATPNYLTLSANQTGLTTLTLTDDPTGTPKSLLTATNQGANTVFELNGLSVTKPSTVVSDVVSGVSFTFLALTDASQTVDITMGSDHSAMASALQDVVTKYNAVSGQVNAQIGTSAGLLSGNAIIGQARQALYSLVSSSDGTGSIHSLASLGIELSNSGVMSFNSDTLDALSASQLSDAYTFLGSTTGGPKAMQSTLTQISDPLTGTIKAQQDQWDAADKRITTQVDDMTAQVNAMQAALKTKLQVADTLLASLTSQQDILTSSISSLNYTSGYTAKANS